MTTNITDDPAVHNPFEQGLLAKIKELEAQLLLAQKHVRQLIESNTELIRTIERVHDSYLDLRNATHNINLLIEGNKEKVKAIMDSHPRQIPSPSIVDQEKLEMINYQIANELNSVAHEVGLIPIIRRERWKQLLSERNDLLQG